MPWNAEKHYVICRFFIDECTRNIIGKRKKMQMKIWKQLAAVMLAVVMAGTAFVGCGKTEDDAKLSTTMVQETTESTSAETESVTETTTVHVSPTEIVSSTLGAELSDINAILDRGSDDTNHYKASLSNFIEEGDVVQSFTFIVYSGNGTTSLGSYKGGYGVSVKESCASATDEGWYQATDFEQSQNSAYAEFTWNVPVEIQTEIDPNGEVLFGHWWSNVEQVKLSSIVCTYTRTREVPVDGTNSTNLGVHLNYNDESSKSAKIDLADLIGSEDTLQTVTFDISSDGALGKFTGAFGVSLTDEGEAYSTDENWYQTQNVCVFTDSGNLSLTWIVPDNIKAYIDPNGVVMLGYWWSDQGTVTLDQISVRYSNATGTTTKTDSEVDSENNNSDNSVVISGDVPTSDEVNSMTSVEIVEDIRVGWNLGNALDSYNTNSNDTETGWGNPKTTKAMFETVQKAGFNAVRIPVTWGEHMSADGTIDSDWMARVKEVVDYAYDLGLYVIINVHHDDYLWLVQSKDKLENNKAVLTNIWRQISTTFRDYDHRLIFEGMNEPRIVGAAEEWTGGTQESYDCINQLFQAFVDTVRSTGGGNAERSLIVTTYAQSVEKKAIEGLKIPDDAHIIVSLHIYAPWDFCGPDDTRADWGSDADKQELNQTFQYLEEKFISQGIPLIIGECGTVNKNGNTSARAAWCQYYLSEAKSHGIKCFLWDDGNQTDGFGLLNRKKCSWYYPEIIDAILDATI